MKGYLTSYPGLFGTRPGGGAAIERIAIPLIQRDYAQGRPDDQTREIRSDFLEVLLDAVVGGEPVGLDFVYGRIEGTTFYPLDGQQRLTTLFLLHWYLASAAGRPEAGTAFSYETRPGSRLFCERLGAHPCLRAPAPPSDWVTDQPWYLHVWHTDPTIQAMLVVLDAIHTQLHSRHPDHEPQAMWERLTDTAAPAVSFHLLPLDDMTSDEALYIKMNSRGKPLTPFETFKARFEQDIEHSDQAGEFAHRIDGPWSDLLWPYHGGDHLVDDEFLHYLGYLTELCELREGRVTSGRLGPRARAVFGEANPRAAEHLDFLFGAFDSWPDDGHIVGVFREVLSSALPGQDGYDHRKVVPFVTGTGTDPFGHCLRNGPEGMNAAQRLLLYAFLLHRIGGTDDFPRRLRVLRNLIAATENELRSVYMPTLVKDVERVIVHGDLDAVQRFSANQVADERRKQLFLDASPDLAPALFRLEDHAVLRGALSVFDLDSATFTDRARAFGILFSGGSLWPRLTGALLTFGDYQRLRPASGSWQFGSPDSEPVWRDLLTGTTYEGLQPFRTALAALLDGLAASNSDPGDHLDQVVAAWLANREESRIFDWRYHLVRYPSMRTGTTGIYYGTDGTLGYAMCMLRTVRLSGYYRDPVLLQVWKSSGAGARVEDPWFSGYETIPRWLRVVGNGVGMRSVDGGFALDVPEDEVLRRKLTEVFDRHGVVEGPDGILLLPIPQHVVAEGLVDVIDRVGAGAAFLRDLVEVSE